MTPSLLPPLKFHPLLKETPWGGTEILRFKHLDSSSSHVGESWEVSDLPQNQSVVSEGSLAGRSLHELVEEYGPRLLGRQGMERHGLRFPLLIKFIDANADLSLQVHPSDAVAHERGLASGKTEMWYVVKSRPDATLLSGWNQAVTPEAYLSHARQGTLCQLVSRRQAPRGSCFFIPAGTVHAICSGIFLIEIQQSSDVTYRLYDYGRPGLDGRPRQLHIAEAQGALNFAPQSEVLSLKPSVEAEVSDRLLVSCPYFTTREHHLSVPHDFEAAQSFRLLIGFDGEATVTTPGGTATLRAGESLLLPQESSTATVSPEATGCALLSVTEDFEA
ncbi:MAG: class I mannose-6-phosphate isomerase [Bacteroidaceae bacterium]|nr:class I mannose-6-phosphate isomerase [Bacteroidaceae bacterium]